VCRRYDVPSSQSSQGAGMSQGGGAGGYDVPSSQSSPGAGMSQGVVQAVMMCLLHSLVRARV